MRTYLFALSNVPAPLVAILCVFAVVFVLIALHSYPDTVCMEFGQARFEERERCVVWTDGEKHWSHYER